MKFATLAFIDVTGGALTAIGLAVAGFTIWWKRGKIIDQFERGLDSGQETLRTELTDKLSVNLRVVYRDIERVFQGFFDEIKSREDELKPRLAVLKECEDGLTHLSQKSKSASDEMVRQTAPSPVPTAN